MRRATLLTLSMLLALLAPLAACLAATPEVKYVDKDTLKSWLGDPKVLILDVRAPNNWDESSRKIKGAVRQDPDREQVPVWGKTLRKDKKIVLYCAWPEEMTSARVARQLLEMGLTNVRVLKGGWNEWEKAGYPMEPKR